MSFFDSPTYCAGHRLHSIRYIMLVVLQVIFCFIGYVLPVRLLLNSVHGSICLQDIHGVWQGFEPGGGLGAGGLLLNVALTRRSRRLEGFRYATSGFFVLK